MSFSMAPDRAHVRPMDYIAKYAKRKDTILLLAHAFLMPQQNMPSMMA